MLFDLERFIAKHVTGRPESLFGEDIAVHRETLQEKINGSRVLVIGGAGTIGASFIKSLLREGTPAGLYVVDFHENGLTELTRDLRSTDNLPLPEAFKTYPIDFGDPVFQKIFKKAGPFDIVANFAAHKHVRSEKDPYSIEAMIGNNVFKAMRLLDLLAGQVPQHFFCVSTDKAANPVNIMGASKKLMEDLILAYATELPVSTARFANVAFSNGSLPAGFLERLSKRQPLSAPMDIRRFFVSPTESGQICMLACLLAEPGDIFFPKLEAQQDMQTFTHIAEQLLNACGYRPDYCETEEEARQKAVRLTPDSRDYPVHFFKSDTSGEKPFEEFYSENEKPDFSKYRSLGVIRSAQKKSRAEITNRVIRLRELFEKEDLNKNDVVEVLSELLPEFRHSETGKNLDQRM